MNIQDIIRVVGDLLLMTTVATVAIDTMKWTFTGKMGEHADNMAIGMIKSVVNLPVNILYAIFNLVLKVIESVIRMVVALVAGKSAASAIEFGQLKI